MRVKMIMKWDGFTPAHYEEIRHTVQWEGNIPEGAVFHVAAFDDKGIRVTDIWESAELCNAFVQNRLMPAIINAGITTQPQVEMLPVHAIFVPALQKIG